MKVAVLGGNGFIGTNLTKSLSKDFEFIMPSLRSVDWSKDIKDADVILNLIGKAHDHRGKATAKDFYFANYDLVKEIFEQSSSKLFIHISSIAAVEEFSTAKWLVETDNCNPVSNYGKSKREAEIFLLEKLKSTNRKVIILRPPMVHGIGDKGNLRLLYRLIARGIPYPLASFDNHRSFISIDNFCYYISEIINKQNNLDSGIYNISDDEPISTKRIINIMKEFIDKKSINLYVPKFFIRMIAKIGDIIPLPINTKKLKKMTGSLLVSNQKIKKALQIDKLPLSAEEGLRLTIKSFKDQYH